MVIIKMDPAGDATKKRSQLVGQKLTANWRCWCAARTGSLYIPITSISH